MHSSIKSHDGHVLAIVAPGQGAQKPGFLAPWCSLENVRSTLEKMSAIVGEDLIALGSDADEQTIRDTAIAQPLLVSAALVTFNALEVDLPPSTIVAGHSVGEFAAAAISSVLTEAEAMRLVTIRGRAMAHASAITDTGMTALLGGDMDEVIAAIETCGLTCANYNGTGQMVAAGTLAQLDELTRHLPKRTRAIPLSVAGAFHSHHMASAVDDLREAASTSVLNSPRTVLLSNRDGSVVSSGDEYVKRLIDQVARPVRWDLCMETMRSHQITGLLELTPSGTLTGIAKRNCPGVELFNLNSVDQIDEARSFIDRHSHV